MSLATLTATVSSLLEQPPGTASLPKISDEVLRQVSTAAPCNTSYDFSELKRGQQEFRDLLKAYKEQAMAISDDQALQAAKGASVNVFSDSAQIKQIIGPMLRFKDAIVRDDMKAVEKVAEEIKGQNRPWLRPTANGWASSGSDPENNFGLGYSLLGQLYGMREKFSYLVKNDHNLTEERLHFLLNPDPLRMPRGIAELPIEDLFTQYDPKLDQAGFYEQVIVLLERQNLNTNLDIGKILQGYTVDTLIESEQVTSTRAPYAPLDEKAGVRILPIKTDGGVIELIPYKGTEKQAIDEWRSSYKQPPTTRELPK